MHGQPGHNTRPHARLPPSEWLHNWKWLWFTSYVGHCCVWLIFLTCGQLVQDWNVCTAFLIKRSVLPCLAVAPWVCLGLCLVHRWPATPACPAGSYEVPSCPYPYAHCRESPGTELKAKQKYNKGLILLVINCFGVWYNLYLAIRWLYHPRRSRGWYSLLIARYKLYHTPKQLITNLSHDCLLDLCTGNKNEHTYIHTNTRRLIQDSERLIQLHITCQLTNQKPRILPIMR